MESKCIRLSKRIKNTNKMVLERDNFFLEISVKGKGLFDWRNTARGLFLEAIIEKSKKFFESLPIDEKKLNDEVNPSSAVRGFFAS